MAKCAARLHDLFRAGLSAILLGMGPCAFADDGESRNVLILASDDSLLPFTQHVTASIVKRLRSEFPNDLTIFTEFMDASRVAQGDAVPDISRYLATKYARRQMGVVFALGPQALALLSRERDALFADVPVVFAGIRRGNALIADLPTRMRGVTSEYDVARTAELAAALQPGLSRIVLVSGASEFDRVWHDRALSDLEKYRARFEITDLAGLPLDALLDTVTRLRPNSAIIYLSIFKDGSGSTFVPSDLALRIATSANVPFYGIHASVFGQGIVGGYISSYEDMGSAAADLALPILSGAAVAPGPGIIDLAGQFRVDWRTMQRWRMDANLLPPGTVVQYRALSLWAEHSVAILTGLGVIAAQTAVIIAFWIQKRRRQRAELSLRQVNEHIEIAATTANLGLWAWSPAEDRIWMTPHCRRMLGVDGHADLDRFLTSLAGPRQISARKSIIEALRTSGTFHGEFRTADSSGRKLCLSATGNCIRHGHDMLMAGTLLDVSDRKMAQIDAEQQRRQIIHLTRVAVLGELSGSLAHELNQPLTAILSNAQTAQRLIARSSPNIAELQEILADIVEDDHRAGAVIGNLRTLIRREEVKHSELDLNQVVDDVLHLVRSDLIERQIQVQTELSDNLPPARGDRVQIQQVLINLVRNACDAMSAEPGQSHRLVLATDRTGNDGLAVTVADNGGGIPDNLRDRLFEPFVTTKAQGLGLGLTVSRSILSAHGGKIWCQNNASGGAIFGFSLPAIERRTAWTS
jgi:signal transduction histidine kinase